MPVSVTPVLKKKQWVRKSGHLENRGTPTQTGKEKDESSYSKVAGPLENRKTKRKIP